MRNRRSLFLHYNVKDLLEKISTPQSLAEQIVEAYFTLDAIIQSSSEDQILEILSLQTSSDGGCLPFSFGLFHERLEVQKCAAKIISRLYLSKLGLGYCNPFVKQTVLNILSPTVYNDVLFSSSTNGFSMKPSPKNIPMGQLSYRPGPKHKTRKEKALSVVGSTSETIQRFQFVRRALSVNTPASFGAINEKDPNNFVNLMPSMEVNESPFESDWGIE